MSAENALTPSRPPSATTAAYRHAHTIAAIDAIERAAGGRAALVAALTGAPPSDDLAYVINLIADPRMDARRLSAICRAGSVSLGEILEALKRGVYAKMTVQVMATIATRTPAIVEDVMTRAAPHPIPCTPCNGTGTVPGGSADAAPVPCNDCRGIGSRMTMPDLDRQRLALDIAGVTPRKSPTVAIDNRSVMVADASPSGLAKLMQVTDQILSGRRPRPIGQGPAEPGPLVRLEGGPDVLP